MDLGMDLFAIFEGNLKRHLRKHRDPHAEHLEAFFDLAISEGSSISSQG